MSPSPRNLFRIALWGLATAAVLHLHYLPGEFEGPLCGPWGWMGPLQALAALHLFWLLMVLPPVWMAAARLSPRGLRRLGVGLTALAFAGLVVAAAVDLHLWLRESPPDFRAYVPHRLAFFLVNCTDVPLPHLAVAGLFCLGLARRRAAACNPAEPR